MNKNVWVYLQESQPDLEETQNMHFFFNDSTERLNQGIDVVKEITQNVSLERVNVNYRGNVKRHSQEIHFISFLNNFFIIFPFLLRYN